MQGIWHIYYFGDIDTCFHVVRNTLLKKILIIYRQGVWYIYYFGANSQKI